MKLKLHKKTKKYILSIMILLLLVTGIQIYSIVKSERTITKEKVLFEYSCQPAVDYSVVIHPNELYSGTILEESTYYSKLLLDYIEASFAFDYQGSYSAPLRIQYQVVASVNGYQGQSDSKTIYWSKSFPLTEEKTIETEGDSFSTEEQITFNLSDYDSFAVRAKQISGMKVSNEVVAELTGKIIAQAAGKEVEIPFSSKLRAPLLEDVFKIDKSIAEPIKGTVTETEKVILPIDRTKLSLLAVLMLLLIVAIPVLLFVIKEPDELTLLRKKNNGLLKNYGSRMVAMKEIPSFEFSRLYQVYSIKDMIKIADEVQRPIIYIPDESTLVRNNELLIINENSLYRWYSA